MCLKLFSCIGKEEAANRFEVFKLVWKSVDPNDNRMLNIFTYTSKDTEYVLGKEIVSSRGQCELTENELEIGVVNQGFHNFISLDRAKKFLDVNMMANNPFYVRELTDGSGRKERGTIIIIRCSVKPEDHVADGANYFVNRVDETRSECVYHKITPIEIIK